MNGDGQAEFAVGTLQSDDTVEVNIYNGAANELATYTAATGASAFALGSVQLPGDTADSLLVGVQPIGGSVGSVGADQVDILSPLSGATTDGFNAFAALVGGCSICRNSRVWDRTVEERRSRVMNWEQTVCSIG